MSLFLSDLDSLLLTPYMYGISSFVYPARRPFHPKRLFDLIHDKFIVLQNVDQVIEEKEDAEDEDIADANSSNDEDEEDDELEGSDTEMEDEMDGKDFAKEIDPKVPISHSLIIIKG
jgi:hypothetical protein